MDSKDYEFKCGGLLGAILQLNAACGVDEAELRKKDEEWAAMLRPVSTPNAD